VQGKASCFALASEENPGVPFGLAGILSTMPFSFFIRQGLDKQFAML